MLRLSIILAGIIAAAHAEASPPRRFLSDDRVVCDGERPQDYCNCHTDCRETGEDAKFCACPEAQACCECRDNDAWAKTDDPEKGCAWVAEFPGVPGDWKRCRAKGVIEGATLGKVFASYACPAACGTPCHDDPSWHVKDDPSKNCAWVSRYPEVRCGLASGAGDLARGDCPAACASERPGPAGKPIGLTVHGAGMRSIVEGAAIARALGEDRLAEVTHLGGCSGGTWFGALLAYSPDFYLDVTDPDKPIEDVIAAWGAQYGETMIAATKPGGPAWATDVPVGHSYNASGPFPACKPILDAYTEVVTTFRDQFAFPPWNWMSYVNAMLKDSIRDFSTLRADAEMRGLATAALVVHANISPDAYLVAPQSAQAQATRSFAFDGAAPPADLNLPAAYVLPAGGDWVVNQKVSSLAVDGGALLTPNPSILELVGGSSAFAGEFGSETFLQTTLATTGALPFLDPPLGPVLNATPGSPDYPAYQLASFCQPFGLQAAGTPLLEDSYQFPADGPQTSSELAEVSENARFRLPDAGFIENTGAAPTIAAMQKSCEAGELDCSGPLKIIVVDQLDQSQGYLRLFAYGPPANEYYQYSYGFGATVPSQQIFAEAAPEPSEFQMYKMNIYKYAYSQGPIGLGFTLGPDAPPRTFRAESQYWHGKATTVANDWYDVKAGSDVEILILNTALGTARGVPTVVVGTFAKEAFEQLYGPLAKSQAEGMEPIVTAFLEGTL